ncbi:hypothetical protein KHO57_gp156 [Mycobacterium phage Phabba]|uniref:Uncharacterized protein n=1 Tax=Mycobacterium phage Phabba TaxID=2027899 RepID=A0A249XSQ1_9CAUD|nr:hypothetical protein KHO57_gp156 [Mycobacterium phage Phabba]ASZ74748.1 hypothetical protein SEA_PHABBA_209 [Mycobacterium phage Phabba]
MTTATKTDVDQQVLTDLEFSPTCEIRVSWSIKIFGFTIRTPPGRRCNKPAPWIGRMPCCGQHVLVCDTHRRDRSIGFPHHGVRWLYIHLIWSKI